MKNKKPREQKPVRIDSRTVIFIDKNANEEKAIRTYMERINKTKDKHINDKY